MLTDTERLEIGEQVRRLAAARERGAWIAVVIEDGTDDAFRDVARAKKGGGKRC